MKQITLTGVALVVAISAHAVWSQTGQTRAQVNAETKQAIRDGELVVDEEGHKANEVNPERYPKQPAVAGKTRAQVKRETQGARQDGEIPAGDLDRTPREENPKRYPAQPTAPGLTRKEVNDETKAAIRAGDVQIGEDGRTLAEKDPSRYAGAPTNAPKLKFKRPFQHKGEPASTPIN